MTDAPATDSDCRRAESGELRLVAAVLRLAIEDAAGGDPDAVAWLASDEQGGRVGWYYRDVCGYLDLSPSWGRAQVAARGRRGARAVAGAGRTEMRPARRKVA